MCRETLNIQQEQSRASLVHFYYKLNVFQKGLVPIIQYNKGQSGQALDKPEQMHFEVWKS